jgi:hypothetical protein
MFRLEKHHLLTAPLYKEIKIGLLGSIFSLYRGTEYSKYNLSLSLEAGGEGATQLGRSDGLHQNGQSCKI